MPSLRTSRSLTLGFVGLGLVGALAGCSSATTTSANASANYKDGTYTEDGSYQSPGGEESITVKLTIVSNKVTAVTVTPHATSGTASVYQAQFVSGISDAVVGKDLNSLNVSRVAGSSLTSGGFNAAVQTIQADAAK
jgi:uncharacterized protein with FMN-binding domain